MYPQMNGKKVFVQAVRRQSFLVRDEDLALRQVESTDHVVLEGRSDVSVPE